LPLQPSNDEATTITAPGGRSTLAESPGAGRRSRHRSQGETAAGRAWRSKSRGVKGSYFSPVFRQQQRQLHLQRPARARLPSTTTTAGGTIATRRHGLGAQLTVKLLLAHGQIGVPSLAGFLIDVTGLGGAKKVVARTDRRSVAARIPLLTSRVWGARMRSAHGPYGIPDSIATSRAASRRTAELRRGSGALGCSVRSPLRRQSAYGADQDLAVLLACGREPPGRCGPVPPSPAAARAAGTSSTQKAAATATGWRRGPLRRPRRR
jgi:hypothetical protein